MCDVDEDLKDNLLVLIEEQVDLELIVFEEVVLVIEFVLVESFDIDIIIFFLLGYKCLIEDENVGVMYFKIGGSLIIDLDFG